MDKGEQEADIKAEDSDVVYSDVVDFIIEHSTACRFIVHTFVALPMSTFCLCHVLSVPTGFQIPVFLVPYLTLNPKQKHGRPGSKTIK